MNSKGEGGFLPSRRTFLVTAVLASPVAISQTSGKTLAGSSSPRTRNEGFKATDFSRSFSYYIPKKENIWVRIQIECRCQVFDRAAGTSDEYLLSVRTQTGLRTKPPSDKLDPGYDFWMIFSKRHVFIKRVHVSSYNDNPTRIAVDQFAASGWHLQPCSVTELRSGTEIRKALQAWRPVVARSEFVSTDGRRGYVIEYPVKWADGNPDSTFRVETGPVVLLDPERVQVGRSPEFAEFQWAYLDYHSFDQVRCFLERPTSILSGATYQSSPATPRRNPALSDEQVAQIEGRLHSGWNPPIPAESLRKLLETDHYSAIEHRKTATTLYALDLAISG
ncbi:MAG: hypothetical protein EXQ58_00230 [Acidobacteria bacterium]|nr:hypothetical protein [Acidobacteriota bacterium]